MTTLALTAAIWFRAQSIYVALGLVGLLLGLFWETGSGVADADSSWLFFLLVLIAAGCALLFGLPAFLALAVVMKALAKPAARFRLLQAAYGITGFAAVNGALYLAFGTTYFTDNMGWELILLLFGLPAYLALLLSIVSLRRTIRDHAEDLRLLASRPGSSSKRSVTAIAE